MYSDTDRRVPVYCIIRRDISCSFGGVISRAVVCLTPLISLKVLILDIKERELLLFKINKKGVRMERDYVIILILTWKSSRDLYNFQDSGTSQRQSPPVAAHPPITHRE